MTPYVYPYLEAVVAAAHDYLPELKTCAIHPGRMSIEGLNKIAVRAPAVHIALLDMPVGLNHQAARGLDLALVAYVTTRDQARMPAEQSATNLVEALADWLPQNAFSRYAHPATNIRAANLYNTQAGKAGVALWGVSWRQKLQLPLEYEEGPLLKRLYIDDGRDTIVVGDDGGEETHA